MRVSNMELTLKNKHLTDTAKVSVFMMKKFWKKVLNMEISWRTVQKE